MARRKNETSRVDLSAFDRAGARVIDNSIKTEIEDSYLEYAYSVIHSRALPDARDGLKPVHRRILWSMYEQGHRPDRPYVKSARVVGDVMGRYHPHGNLAIYDAMVRLAQDFSLNTPLIDGHGNFGSPDDGPAAERYCVTGDTRVRLADGTSPRIADLVALPPDSEADADFAVLDKDGKAVQVDKVFNSGVHPTRRITTKSGYSLRGSENHPVLCLEAPMGVPLFQWRRLDDIQPGSVVCVARNAWTQVIPTPREYVLGVLGAAWASRGWAGEQRESVGRTAGDKQVPEFVWTGGPGVKRAFLMAAFEGDGGLRAAVDGLTVQYCSHSGELVRGIQEMLAEFGVIAAHRRHTRAGGSVEHRLVVSGPRNVRGFVERVGFLRTKQEEAEEHLRHSAPRPHLLGGDRVPFVAEYVRGALDLGRRGGGRGGLAEYDFDRMERWETERLDIIDRIDDPEILATILPIMDSGYRFEEVASAEGCAPAEVYSVRVLSADHSFLAGGFVNHNTESRMSREAVLLVGELGEGTVDFKPNYDGSEQEPKVLPAAFPNLLVNGTSGIAVGMATNMIPHNLAEMVAAARHLITDPEADLDTLMRYVPGPDLPTGGQLLGLDEVRRAYETGRGVVRMRARATTGPLDGGRGRQAITVVELPYGVGTEKIIEAITDEVKGKLIVSGPRKGQRQAARLQGIADVKDLTDREHGTRLVIECKVGVNPQALLADLYRLTPMESSFGINNLVLVDGQPQTLGLKALLEVFLHHRYEVVTRRTTHRRTKRQDRLHLVDGLLIALIDIDRVVAIIRASDDAAAARLGLMSEFALTEIQANYILDTPLRRLTRFDRIELETEQERLRDEIAELSRILDDEEVLKQVVSDELAEVATEFGFARRTTLIDGDLKEVLAASAPAGPLEVADDPCQVILSATGLIARTAAESEEATEARRRSGRVKHDAVRAVVHATARGRVLLVTNTGRAFKIDVLPLPVLPEQSGTVSVRGGMSASELAPLQKGERVVGLAPLTTGGQSPGLVMGTRQGVVKVCAPEWPVRSDEFDVITLRDGDEVLQATWLTGGNESLVFVTSDASMLRFPSKLVRPQGLKGGGMAGVSLTGDAEVISFNVVDTSDPQHGEPMVVTSTGTQVKVTPFAQYPAKGRATGGVRVQRFLKGESRLTVAWVGPRPVGASNTGEPVELPPPDNRRDGSGQAVLMGPQIIGHQIERT